MKGWIVIADATRARIFSAPGRGPLHLVQTLEHPRSRTRPHEAGGDERGRVRKGIPGGRRAAMEPRTDPHAVEVGRFTRELGNALRAGLDRHAFDALAIVAPPRLLGLLRDDVGEKVGRHLRASVALNCTRVAAEDLPAHLRDDLPGWFHPVPPRPGKRQGRPPRHGVEPAPVPVPAGT